MFEDLVKIYEWFPTFFTWGHFYLVEGHEGPQGKTYLNLTDLYDT